MKKFLVVLFVLIIAVLSVMAVSADQNGTDIWCNKDSYGCWITGEDGEQVYIMFWSESARDYIMGSGDSTVTTNPDSSDILKLDKRF